MRWAWVLGKDENRKIAQRVERPHTWVELSLFSLPRQQARQTLDLFTADGLFVAVADRPNVEARVLAVERANACGLRRRGECHLELVEVLWFDLCSRGKRLG